MSKEYRYIGYFFLISFPIISLTNSTDIFSITVNGLDFRLIDFLFLCNLFFLLLYLTKFKNISYSIALIIFLNFLLFFSTLIYMLFTGENVDYLSLMRFLQTIIWGIFAYVSINDVQQLHKLILIIIIAGSFISLSSIFIALTRDGITRNAGIFGAADGNGLGSQASFNEIGAILALVCGLILLKVLTKSLSKKNLILYQILLLINIFGLILTQSRSSQLSLVLVIIYFLLSKGIKKRRKIALGIGLIVLSVSASLILDFNAVFKRLSDTFNYSSSAGNSLLSRFEIWTDLTSYLTQNPFNLIFGFGYGNMEEYLNYSDAHNVFLNIIASFGILGILFISIFFFYLFLLTKNCKKYAEISLILKVNLLIALGISVTGNTIVDPFYGGLFWILILAVNRLTKKEGYFEKENTILSTNSKLHRFRKKFI